MEGPFVLLSILILCFWVFILVRWIKMTSDIRHIKELLSQILNERSSSIRNYDGKTRNTNADKRSVFDEYTREELDHMSFYQLKKLQEQEDRDNLGE